MKLFSRFIIFLMLFASISGYAQTERILDYAAEDTIYVIGERNKKFLQTSTMATKARLPLINAPVSISIISQAVNQNQGNLVLGEALNNVSGVNAQTGFGIHDYFVVRGFNTLENGLLLTDGTPEPEVIIYNLYNIDRVEVLKGPGAFLYGGNPLSGTINLVRKQPTFKNFLNATGSYGSFKSYRGAVDGGFVNSKKNLSGRFNGLFQQSDFYRDNKENKTYAFNPSVSWRIDETSELSANVEFLTSEYKPDSGLPLVYNFQTGQLDQLADVDRTTSYQTPADYSDQQMLRFKLNYVRQIDSVSTVTNRFYYTDLDWKTSGTLLNGAYPAMDGSLWVSRTLQLLDDRQKLLGNQTELSSRIWTGHIQHDLMFGFEMNRLIDIFEIDIVPQLPSLSLSNPVETYQQSLYPAYYYQHRDAKSTVVAPYFMDIISLSAKARLFLGGRYDRIALKEKKTLTTKRHNKFSPMVGLSYSLCQDMTIYANAGQAFAPPSSRADGNLGPEQSQQVELGLKNVWLNGKIRSAISLYQLEKENIAIPDKNGFAQQVGSQMSKGVEFEVQAQMAMQCASIFSYAFTNAEMTEFAESVTVGQDEMGYPIMAIVDRSGNESAFAPQHIINFWHTRDFGKHFGFGAGVRYVSSQFIAEDNVYAIDGFTTVNATVYCKLGGQRWFLNFKNISDTKYEMRGFGGYSVIPAAPFTVYGGVDIAL
jgi:iron complex outermembrane recepter protein